MQPFAVLILMSPMHINTSYYVDLCISSFCNEYSHTYAHKHANSSTAFLSLRVYGNNAQLQAALRLNTNAYTYSVES